MRAKWWWCDVDETRPSWRRRRRRVRAVMRRLLLLRSDDVAVGGAARVRTVGVPWLIGTTAARPRVAHHCRRWWEARAVAAAGARSCVGRGATAAGVGGAVRRSAP